MASWAEIVPTSKASPLEQSIRSRVEAQRTKLKTFVPKLKALGRAIAAKPGFSQVTHSLKKDAGPFLNPRVDWGDVRKDARSKAAYEKFMSVGANAKNAKLVPPESASAQMNSLGADLIKRAGQVDLSGVDFTWMRQLRAYDSWDLDSDSPLALLAPYDFTMNPVPDFVGLVTWIRLKLVKGGQDKDHKSAADEATHLARLMMSTETLIGIAAGVAGLKTVAQFAIERGQTPPFDVSALNDVKIYAVALAAALGSPLLAECDAVELLREGSGPAFCAAVNDAGREFLLYRPLLCSRPAGPYAKFSMALGSKSACRWKDLREAWAGAPRYVVNFRSLPAASAPARKQALALAKSMFTPADYAALSANVGDPWWPRQFGYLSALASMPDKVLAALDAR